MRRWNATQPLLVTKGLIALNVVVLVLGLRDNGQRQALDYGLYGPYVKHGDWWRLITSGFLHAGALHLAMNMLALYQLGRLLEPALGRVNYLTLYGAALLAGSAGALVVAPDALTVGASGAIFGLLGAVAAGMHSRGASIWRSGIGTLIVVNLLITFALPRISIGGHLGGLVGGAVAGYAFLRPGRRSRPGAIDPVGIAVALVVGFVAFVIGLNAG